MPRVSSSSTSDPATSSNPMENDYTSPFPISPRLSRSTRGNSLRNPFVIERSNRGNSLPDPIDDPIDDFINRLVNSSTDQLADDSFADYSSTNEPHISSPISNTSRWINPHEWFEDSQQTDMDDIPPLIDMDDIPPLIDMDDIPTLIVHYYPFSPSEGSLSYPDEFVNLQRITNSRSARFGNSMRELHELVHHHNIVRNQREEVIQNDNGEEVLVTYDLNYIFDLENQIERMIDTINNNEIIGANGHYLYDQYISGSPNRVLVSQ